MTVKSKSRIARDQQIWPSIWLQEIAAARTRLRNNYCKVLYELEIEVNLNVALHLDPKLARSTLMREDGLPLGSEMTGGFCVTGVLAEVPPFHRCTK
jgi:hypothetical protein